MSDISQGPGWWQASDGKWYPPEQAPAGQPADAQPPAGQPPAGQPPMGAPAGQAPMGQPAYGAAAPAGVPGPLASWGERAIGYLIDFGLIFAGWVALFIITLIVGAVSDVLATLILLVGYIVLTLAFLFFGFLVGQNGASPGMRLTGLKCVSEETGQVIGGGMGVVRTIAHILDSIVCYIGWFLPLFDDKNQTISDKVIKTVVLKDQNKESFGPELFKPQ